MSFFTFIPHSLNKSGDGPGGVQNVILWLRTDKAHINAPEALTQTGSLVDVWYDQSRRDHHAFAYGDSRPVRTSAAVLCHSYEVPAFEFDGVDDYCKTLALAETFDFSLAKRISVHCAFRAENQEDGTLFTLSNTGVARDGISFSLVPNGCLVRLTLGVDCDGISEFSPQTLIYPFGKLYDDGEIHTFSLLFDADSLTHTLKLFFDEVEINVPITTPHLYGASNIITIGRSEPAGDYFKGEIFELIALPTAREADRNIIYKYFQRKLCV